MAKKSLLRFLKKLDKDLVNRSKNYRASVSDKKPHTFFVTKEGLRNTVIAQAEKDKVKGRRRKIKAASDKLFSDLTRVVKTYNPKDVTIFDKTITSNSISITFQFNADLATENRSKFASTFSLVRDDLYKVAAKKGFRKRMEKIYGERNKEIRKTRGRRQSDIFLDIGHAEESAVYKQPLVEGLLARGEIPRSLLAIKEVGALFFIRKELDTIQVTLESATINRFEKNDKAAKAELEQKLAAAIAALDVPNVSGSDSFVETNQKRITNRVVEPIKALKAQGMIVKGPKKEKIQKKTTKTKFKKESKVTSSSQGAAAAVALGAAKKTEQLKPTEQINLRDLIGVLNHRLPQTVEKNMGPPRLTNQTGRFANSTRITDIGVTTQGFPSVGYTYDKNPYQTFEVGYKQGSQDLDPRKLIDASIREIAAQFAIGRFYTRRV